MIEFDADVERGGQPLELRFTAPSDGITVLFGASGAGKSTVLELLAGALRPARGRIVLDGEVLTDVARGVHVPLERRRIGWVFQDGRLFPHLRVRDNLEFGLRRARTTASTAALGFDHVVGVLGLGALLARWPHELSGGERQRVAIGRALLAQPRLLLLDEPLASLDAARRGEILALLERVRREAAVPMVHVTHSFAEMLRLADHLVLIDAGRVVAEGAARDLMGRGDVPLLSQRADAGTRLDAIVHAQDPDGLGTELAVGAARLKVASLPLAPGAAVRCYVVASDVMLATSRPQGISVRNVLACEVTRLLPRDRGAVFVELQVEGQRLLATVTASAAAELGLAAGMRVHALIKSVALDAPAGMHRLGMQDGT